MSDEVSNFLRSVEQLKERRDQEDEARTRELEEKFLQERAERQARRAERARSISPQKSSPANTPPPTSHRSQLSTDGLKLDRHASPPARADATDALTDYSISPTKDHNHGFDSETDRSSVTLTSPSTIAPSIRSPLSWQRRPTSQASERPKSRPLSMVAAENAAARSSPVLADPEETPSRDQIANALSAKDPSWFRQTPDRGQNSPAYRRSQVEDQDTLDMSSVSRALPGMTANSASDPAKESYGRRPSSPSGRVGTPLKLIGVPKLDHSSAGGLEETGLSSSDRQGPAETGGRISPTRPISPTKGLGGFVQSAMMKRSDSVKRWSVTSPPGLQRADSVASNRNSLEHAERAPNSTSRPRSSLLRDGSKTPTSRPTSSHDQDSESGVTRRPSLDKLATEQLEGEDKSTIPTSPSKTMDARRWSPTKASWLETALNKPESPKPKPTPPPSNQPAWMVELNKAKAQRANSGTPEPSTNNSASRKHEVKTGGLMRSSPMGSTAKPSSMGGPKIPVDTAPVRSFRDNLTKRSSNAGSEDGDQDKGEATLSPKPDFRANLKARQPAPDSGKPGGSDDFQNVFGNLRRTKTQNYVAPDVLKDNILRGKGALNVTGGPKKTERRDEFKDAILKKKEDFKKAQQDGRGVKRDSNTPGEKPIPEGLAKRIEMNRSGTVSKRDSASSDAPSENISATAESNRSSSISSFSRRDSADVMSPPTPKQAPPVEKEVPAQVPTLQKETSAPARLQSRTGGSALADRFNPALAGILARGPPGMGGGGKADEPSSSQPATTAAESDTPTGPGPQLTHMTKNRARGPRRKAPTSGTAPSADTQISESSSIDPPLKIGSVNVQSAEKPISKPEAPKPAPIQLRTDKPAPAPVQLKTDKPVPAPLQLKADKPVLPAKSGVVSLVDSSKKYVGHDRTGSIGQVISLVDSKKKTIETPQSAGQPIAFGNKIQTKPNGGSEAATKNTIPEPQSPSKLNVKRMSQFLEDADQTKFNAQTAKLRPASPTKSRPLPNPVTSGSQVKLVNDKVDSDPVVSVKNAKNIFAGSNGQSETAANTSAEGASRFQSKRPPSLHATRGGPLSPSLSSPSKSPTKYTMEVSAMLTDFFGPDRPKREYHIDAAEILMRRPAANPKIRTQKTQLFQLAADGKRQPVPLHYERVLFENEMYLCPHTFLNEAGKKMSEVYFWAGDEVPQSSIEDAHVFIQRETRQFGGKLVKMEQGKETPEFIQALDGIVIVRRGSSNKFDSLAPSMLCGRSYLGQIAFDEVDLSPNSLCSGFPYLITRHGKCYLWKGKGSDVDELSCARLIGMDFALMGELVEVEDGKEPSDFWDIFEDNGAGARFGSADHWRLKPHYDKYCGRLFRSDAADRKQIAELSPFSQSDLSSAKVYVLDAFFEMYVIVGARARDQYAAFHNALDFAQEYAILASSMEDRPFVPVCTVVLEGVPRDLKSVFRKWRDSAGPTATNQTGGDLKRGRSLRIVPLGQALQALTG